MSLPNTPPAAAEPIKQDGPTGLGGWLILVVLGLILNPIRIAVFVLQTYPPIFSTGAWEAVTTPGSETYHVLWGPLLIFELLGNTALILACAGLLMLFFRRSRRFPRFYIVFAIINLIFVTLDAWLGSLVIVDEPMFDPETAKEFSRSLVTVLVWVPYMLRSKRVRNTFVH